MSIGGYLINNRFIDQASLDTYIRAFLFSLVFLLYAIKFKKKILFPSIKVGLKFGIGILWVTIINFSAIDFFKEGCFCNYDCGVLYIITLES